MDNPTQGEPIGGKRYATLRGTTASLTATACHGPIHRPGGPAGEVTR
ncbi:DUF6380 family protein [Streptomyces ipomoeae]|jgi:hypothetical protein